MSADREVRLLDRSLAMSADREVRLLDRSLGRSGERWRCRQTGRFGCWTGAWVGDSGYESWS